MHRALNLKTVLAPALLAVCVLAVGCIPVKNVEKAWKNSKADNALVGTWHQKGGGDGKVGFVKTDKDFLVTSGTDGLEGGCRSFESNGHKFIIVAGLRAAVLGFDLIDDDSKDGTILRYKIDNGTLSIFTYDDGRLKVAVEDGKVAGEVDENDSVSIKELDEKTIAWLGKAADGPGWTEKAYEKK